MRKLRLHELGRPDISTYNDLNKHSVTVVLDNLRSGANVGSIFRTCDAFLVREVVLCGITPQPPHREILKTAIGANRSVRWRYHEEVAEVIKELSSDHHIIAIEQTDSSNSLDNYEVDCNLNYALVFGNEVDGVSESVLEGAHEALEIPQYGTKHSLNVAVCAGLTIWHFTKAFGHLG